MGPTVLAGALSGISPQHLISTYGTLGVVLIIFAETGLLLGFFLPGDSLLFLAGAYSATSKPGEPHLMLGVILVGAAVAALAGAQAGYLIGRRAGPRLFARSDSRLFKQEYVEKTEQFLTQFGPVKAVVLARFVPIVRTFMNPVAGVVRMPSRQFVTANIGGGLVWALGVTLLGYALGATIPIDRYILPITAVVILLSLLPILLEYRRGQGRRRARAAGRSGPGPTVSDPAGAPSAD